MISIILQFLLAFIIWMFINVLVYFTVDIYELPQKSKIFNYKPFNCRLCCSFWSNTFVFLITFFATNYQFYSYLIFGLILTILNAIAMKVDEKRRTVYFNTK